MKHLLTFLLVLSSFVTIGQVGFSSYNRNSHTLFGTASLPADQKGVWITDNSNVEAILFAQTPAGYEQSLREIAKILAFYKLSFNLPEDDSSILDKNISVMKCASMSRELYNGNVIVQRLWKVRSDMTIAWVCGMQGNGIVLAKI